MLSGTVISLQGTYPEERIECVHKDACAEFCYCKVNNRKREKKRENPDELLGSY